MADDDELIPRAIRAAFCRACEALAPVDDASFTWAFLYAEAEGRDFRARLDTQLARDRTRLAEQLVAYRHGKFSAEAFRDWVDADLTAERIVARALAAAPADPWKLPGKRCGCGRPVTTDSWSRLPLVTTIDAGRDVGGLLERRTCPTCGATITVTRAMDAMRRPPR